MELIVTPNKKLDKGKKYIFLTKYLSSFYKISSKNKNIKILKNDKFFANRKFVHENYLFSKRKLTIYREELRIILNRYHNLNKSNKYWGLNLDMILFSLIRDLKYKFDIIKNSKIYKTDFKFEIGESTVFHESSQDLTHDLTLSNKENFLFYNIIRVLKNKNKEKLEKKKTFFKKKSNRFTLINLFKQIILRTYIIIFKPIILVKPYTGFKNCLKIFFKSFGRIITINNFKFNQNFNEIDFDFRNSFKIKEKDLFDKIFNTVIGELFPKNYIENFSSIKSNKLFLSIIKNSKKICCGNHFFDDDICILASELKENNKKFIIFQHGGLFGTRVDSILEDFDKLYGDKLYYWTTKFGLGDNYLSRFPIRKKKKYHNITLMCSRIGLTIGFRSQLLTEKDNPFLSKTYEIYKYLKPSLREIFYVKLFPKDRMKVLQKEEWLNFTGNKVKFINDKKDLFSSKLVILDQISTAFFEMLKMDIPFLIQEDIKNVNFNKKYQKLFSDIKKIGLVFNNYYEMSRFINKNYNNIDDWWAEIKKNKSFIKFKKNIFTPSTNYSSQITKELLNN